MFFILSKTIGLLTYPLSLAFIGFLLFAVLRKRREKWALGSFWFGFALLWFFSTSWGTDLMLRPLEKPFANRDLPAKVDAILVLGGSLELSLSSPGQLEYNPAIDRFIYSLKLARRYPQALVIFSGGTADLFDQSKTEASLLKQDAEFFGVPAERLRVDDKSRNTRENATEAKKILDAAGRTDVVLITSAFHMRRSLGCARKAGIEATPYAVDFRGHWDTPNRLGWVPNANALADSSAAVREYVGLLAYRLQGYI
ncbi:MAG: YdcF family protein [Armatimonadota bacterium]